MWPQCPSQKEKLNYDVASTEPKSFSDKKSDQGYSEKNQFQ
jgi:hypothetical protein